MFKKKSYALLVYFWWSSVKRSIVNVSGLVLGVAAVVYGSHRVVQTFGIVDWLRAHSS